MKINDKKTWDKLIYGLLYPGFLGSLIYELVPSQDLVNNYKKIGCSAFWYYFELSTLIRIGIIIFYVLDYIHLYGDMEDALKNNQKNKKWYYYLVDIITSMLYVSCFILVKFEKFDVIYWLFAFIPIVFAGYKFKNYSDRIYHSIYLGIIVIIFILRWTSIFSVSDELFAVLIVWASLFLYLCYITWYYEKHHSRAINRILYKSK